MEISKNITKNAVFVFSVGLLFSLIIGFLPLLILRGNAYFMIHDQLDSFVVLEKFAARFFEPVIPELMGGIDRSLVSSSTFVTSIANYMFSPFAAFLAIYLFTIVFSYAGMYLCLNEIFGMRCFAAMIAVSYVLLPFYPYALSVMGQPLFLYACLCLMKKKHVFLGYAVVVFFALSSSIVLCGYIDIIFLFILTLYLYLKKHPSVYCVFVAFCLLTAIYFIVNISLVQQFSIYNTPTNRSMWVIENMTMPNFQGAWNSAKSIIPVFLSMFTKGQYHAASLHAPIMYVAIALFPFVLFFGYDGNDINKRNFMIALLCVVVFAAVFYAFWNFLPILVVRHWIGGVFVSFQMDRFYCLNPAVWYLNLGCIVYYIDYFFRKILRTAVVLPVGRKGNGYLVGTDEHVRCIRNSISVQGSVKVFMMRAHLSSVFSLIILVFVFCCVVGSNSVLTKNIGRVIYGVKGGYGSPDFSWNTFFDVELFEEIKEYIGMPQEEYRVGSIGIHPAVALYNGFYCIDGYQPAYPLEYMLKFRKIIAKELEKSETLKIYFDKWGSRCYLFTSELGKKFIFGKHELVVLENLELDGDALKSIGCDYVFSAVSIENPSFSGLEFLTNFISNNSAYNIHLYKVM